MYVPVSSLVVSVAVISAPKLMAVVSVAHTCTVPPSSATLNMVGMDTVGAENRGRNCMYSRHSKSCMVRPDLLLF